MKQWDVNIDGLVFHVDGCYVKGEPEILYLPDGSGQPKEDPYVEINSVCVCDVDVFRALSDTVIERIEKEIIKQENDCH